MPKKRVILQDVAEYYQEMFIKHSDIDYKLISNHRAKLILGSFLRLPRWLQTKVINDLIKLGLCERKSQDIIEIKSSSLE